MWKFNYKYYWAIGWLCIGLLHTHCRSQKSKVTPAFYYWKTIFNLSTNERKYLKELQIKRLYVRYFDIDWNPYRKEAQPIAELKWQTQNIPIPHLVPTVFITNRTLLNISYNQLEKLGNNIANKILEKSKNLRNVTIREVQLDCDWSGKTQKRFFKLIEILREQVKGNGIKTLSATIRLHQLKYYKKTGVPPVDRGMLMFYNMGSLDGKNTNNSILDLQIAQQYLGKSKKYPLQLDVALPIYQWGVLIRRGRVIKLLNSLKNNTFVNTRFFRQKQKQVFEVIKSTYLNGVYLYKGDLIRLEQVSAHNLQQAAKLLRRYIVSNQLYITLYHLDEKNLKNYEPKELKSIFYSF
ncbi:hypothetical protein [Microscilla marina]|uniref:hypothetical protein n=1 Tax=Microscilla marina TaxID=1027 RepID=UPI00031B21BA|nr:hypothetical protein [Microscilla marina]